ncbi:MAG: hypothetical protein A2W33_06840 [Chloroflexi bacterium RBG_16_52_11]|nr:MAG: hypothetical protein A2W33_06840 [Chloroflexi bacterium RBG_16_52_11]
MSQSITFKQAAFIVVFLAVVQFAIQMSLLTRGVKYAAISLIIDDTYYYLQTAWNTKQLGIVTFDGLHTTNGVQLLWFAIIYLLALLAKAKITLLFTTLAVSFLLNGLCYIFILKIGAVLKRPLLILFMGSLWSLQSLPFRIYSMGMENSLHALLFWCAIWQSVVFLIRVQNRDKPNFWGLTIVLILTAWTRLDSALLSAILYSYCMVILAYTYRHNFRPFLQRYLKPIIGSSLLASFGLITQLTIFRLMGDSFLPVSALVKMGGAARGFGAESLDKFVEALILGMPSILQGRFPAPALVLLGVFCILFVIRAKVALPNHQGELGAFLNVWSCLLIGELLYHIYIAISGVEYTPYFAWYRSPSFIFWIITLSLVALFTYEQIKLVIHPFIILKWAPVGFSLIIFSVAIYMFARSINFSSKLYTARYNAALWVSENSLPDTVFASWNAGQLSFFSNRTFINLDGVINNVDYYDRVLRGSMSITDYLSENNVEYVVDYATYGLIPEFPIVHNFPIDDGSGRSIQIWQVSPEVSSTP